MVAYMCIYIRTYNTYIYVCTVFFCVTNSVLTSIQNAVPIRGDPHILIVGDPGLGKSQVSAYICVRTVAISQAYTYA